MERDVPYTELQRGWAALLGWHRWDSVPGNHRKPFWWKPMEDKFRDGFTAYAQINSGNFGRLPPLMHIMYTYDVANVFEYEGVPNPEEHNHEDNIQVARLPAE